MRAIADQPIDTEAGPTEILILADDGADPANVAADLISQAEHGPHSASVLVTPSGLLADAVARTLEAQLRRIRDMIRALEDPTE